MRFGGPAGRVGATVRARRRLVASGTALAFLAGTLVVLALKYDGSPIHDVDLNDGGVWVTNGDLQLMARLNSQVKELDLGVVTSSTASAIYQEAASVQAFDDGGGNADGAFYVTDVVHGTVLPVSLPAGFVARAARDAVVILDRGTGRVWFRRADQLEGFNDTVPEDLKVSERSTAVVSSSGTMLVADRATGKVTAWSLGTAGTPVKGDEYDFGGKLFDDAEISAVGDRPVVLQGGKLLRDGGDEVAVPGDDAVLQQPGPDAGDVYVASDKGLYQAGVSGGDLDKVSTLDVDGAPAAPAVVAGCVHAAWADAGTDNYFRRCDDDEPFTGEIKPLTGTSDLVFRSNRDVVVLNDIDNGNSWMVQVKGLTLVDNWESVDPNAKDQQIAQASDKQTHDKRNEPPTAKDDEFGARPGATVILPVTLNDIDPDGDILTLTHPPASTRGTSFSVVGDGTQVQARVSPDAKGTVSFDYEISDGRPQHTPSKATVKLHVVTGDRDTRPGLINKDQHNRLRVARGMQASVNVLPAWIDPEGDSPVLVGAQSDGGEVGFRPDGTIDFTDDGTSTGHETIEFTVRGGDAEAKGSVDVEVVDPAKAAPTAVADHFTGVVGSDVLIEPLRNDTDPLGGQLTVPRMTNVGGGPAQIVKDTQRGTATFRAAQHGTYYLEYEATSSNGQSSDPQLVRVDVRPRTGSNREPIATRDIAVVNDNGSALVDVLANDSDPDGDVLVVQGVDVPTRWADKVKASLINKRFIRVEVVGELKGVRPEFEYLLSDGRGDQVRGSVFVTSARAGVNRRPQAVDDVVTARAGTIINIPVLANDEDPDGDKLHVDQQDLGDLDRDRPVISSKKVPIVATGSSIRVLVPDDGTTQLAFLYGIRDADQSRDDARLAINIKPATPKGNRAPQPRPIEDRTVTGQKIRVPVDSFGADPDGDPVVFTGVVEPPKFGRIVRSGADWFEYEPFDGKANTGTDEFKVQVSDQYGATGSAEVRIGVASRSPENQAPAALDDTLLVKPGLTITYPVLQNDSDPDGDPLVLDHELGNPEGTQASVSGTSIQMHVPDLGGKSEVNPVTQYTVTDGLGSSSTALLSITGRADAPDHAPTTQDDIAGADQLKGKEAGDTVDVDVLKNDGDLDGARSDLDLEAVRPKVSAVVDRKLRVTLARDSQVIPYRVTDATGQSSFGFVYVTGTDNMPPMLDAAAVPVKAKAGEKTTIDLDDVVVVRPGRSPRIARTDRLHGANVDPKAEGPSRLGITTAKSFYGPGSVTLDVLDGKDLNDPTSLQSQITIPVTVLPAGNVRPTVRSASVVVRAGEEPVTVDLQRLAQDPNEGDDLSFEVTGARSGVSTGIKDDVLSISAGDDAPSSELELSVEASDGEAGPVAGTIRVQVIGRNAADQEVARPPMTLRELSEPDAEVGKRVEVDVRQAVVVDPYPGKGKEVTSVAVTSGSGSGASASGTRVGVTPTKAGELVLTYQLSDGSGDPDRDITGRVLVVVADVPDAPGRPHALEGGPDSIRLSWNAPAENGRPIQHYVAKAVQGGGGDRECPATQCVIDGLDPGTEYSFTVQAVNEVGPSKPSPASVAVEPNTVPGVMSAPVIENPYTDRDGKLVLRWQPPTNEGSDITGYEIQKSPGGEIHTAGPTARTYTWGGLANGTDFTFTIRAVNKRGPGEWSPPSEPQKPFTKPSVMVAPDLKAYNDDGKAGGYLEVSWSQVVSPQDGYDDVTSYDVQLFKDGALSTTVNVDAGSTVRSFNVENGHEYSATVRATNRAGTSDWSSRSAASISWDKASAPTITGSSDCPGGSCSASTSSYTGGVTYSPPANDGGYPVTSYTWTTSDGASGRWDNPSGNDTVTFAGIGAGKSVTITPYTAVPGHDGGVAGTPTTGGSFSPYAKPFPPSLVDASTSQYMKVSIKIDCNTGNGRPVKNFFLDNPSSGSDSFLVPLPCDTVVTVPWSNVEGGASRCTAAHVKTIAGLSATSARWCGHAAARTVDILFIKRGTTAGCYSPCYDVKVAVAGFLNGTYTVYEQSTGSGTCPGSQTDSVSVPSGNDGAGRGTSGQILWISSTCDKVSVTVDGIPREESIP